MNKILKRTLWGCGIIVVVLPILLWILFGLWVNRIVYNIENGHDIKGVSRFYSIAKEARNGPEAVYWGKRMLYWTREQRTFFGEKACGENCRPEDFSFLLTAYEEFEHEEDRAGKLRSELDDILKQVPSKRRILLNELRDQLLRESGMIESNNVAAKDH